MENIFESAKPGDRFEPRLAKTEIIFRRSISTENGTLYECEFLSPRGDKVIRNFKSDGSICLDTKGPHNLDIIDKIK